MAPTPGNVHYYNLLNPPLPAAFFTYHLTWQYTNHSTSAEHKTKAIPPKHMPFKTSRSNDNSRKLVTNIHLQKGPPKLHLRDAADSGVLVLSASDSGRRVTAPEWLHHSGSICAPQSCSHSAAADGRVRSVSSSRRVDGRPGTSSHLAQVRRRWLDGSRHWWTWGNITFGPSTASVLARGRVGGSRARSRCLLVSPQNKPGRSNTENIWFPSELLGICMTGTSYMWHLEKPIQTPPH